MHITNEARQELVERAEFFLDMTLLLQLSNRELEHLVKQVKALYSEAMSNQH